MQAKTHIREVVQELIQVLDLQSDVAECLADHHEYNLDIAIHTFLEEPRKALQEMGLPTSKSNAIVHVLEQAEEEEPKGEDVCPSCYTNFADVRTNKCGNRFCHSCVKLALTAAVKGGRIPMRCLASDVDRKGGITRCSSVLPLTSLQRLGIGDKEILIWPVPRFHGYAAAQDMEEGVSRSIRQVWEEHLRGIPYEVVVASDEDEEGGAIGLGFAVLGFQDPCHVQAVLALHHSTKPLVLHGAPVHVERGGWLSAGYLRSAHKLLMLQYRSCQNKACGALVFVGKTSLGTVECRRCSEAMCLKCSAGDHRPAPCEAVRNWENEGGATATSKEDLETRRMIYHKTKPCPKCQVPISKNGGNTKDHPPPSCHVGILFSMLLKKKKKLKQGRHAPSKK